MGKTAWNIIIIMSGTNNDVDVSVYPRKLTEIENMVGDQRP